MGWAQQRSTPPATISSQDAFAELPTEATAGALHKHSKRPSRLSHVSARLQGNDLHSSTSTQPLSVIS